MQIKLFNHLLGQVHSESYNYTIKIINPRRKRDFIVRNWHNVHEKFNSIRDLKKKLLDTISGDISDKDDFCVGYSEKRSNSKRWIKTRDDINSMYKTYGTGDTISELKIHN